MPRDRERFPERINLRRYFTRVLYRSKSVASLVFFLYPVEAKRYRKERLRERVAMPGRYVFFLRRVSRPHERGVVPLVALLTDERRVFAFSLFVEFVDNASRILSRRRIDRRNERNGNEFLPSRVEHVISGDRELFLESRSPLLAEERKAGEKRSATTKCVNSVCHVCILEECSREMADARGCW